MSIGTINKAATGLTTFSHGLDVISNNVANLNTPGFKKTDLLFRELFYRYQITSDSDGEISTSQIGNGVTDKGTLISFAQGDIQNTGNDTDVAINGNGFFVLRDENTVYFSRAGQFEFDSDNYLVSTTLDARVAGFDENGNLVDINIQDLRSLPPLATSRISLIGNLSADDSEHEISSVSVIDNAGQTHNLNIALVNNSSVIERSFLVNIEDEDGNSLVSNQEIRYGTDFFPETGFNVVTFNIESDQGDSNEIELFFGEDGLSNGATFYSSGDVSSLAVDNVDGYGAGSLVDFRFENDGRMTVSYTNEQTNDAGQLALAWFNQLQSLQQIGNGLFLAPSDMEVQYSRPAENGMGDIVGRSIELSNIDLTQEFTDLIIMQRGYQASSQVITVANEMLQQLLDTGKNR